MKYLKNYENINESSFLTKTKIHIICKKYGIKNYTINSDDSIDVYGYVNLENKNLTKLPLKFRNVSGYFHCNNNKLTSLEGSPNQVGNFDCSYNNLTSLEGCPKYVGGYFYCTNNNIRSLEGFPLNLGYSFICNCNPVFQIWKLFRDKSKVELFIDYDIIRGTDIVIDRLNDFLITIGKKPVKSVREYNNI